jgi:hypothetical protein
MISPDLPAPAEASVHMVRPVPGFAQARNRFPFWSKAGTGLFGIMR